MIFGFDNNLQCQTARSEHKTASDLSESESISVINSSSDWPWSAKNRLHFLNSMPNTCFFGVVIMNQTHSYHLILCFHTDLESNCIRIWFTGLQGFTNIYFSYVFKSYLLVRWDAKPWTRIYGFDNNLICNVKQLLLETKPRQIWAEVNQHQLILTAAKNRLHFLYTPNIFIYFRGEFWIRHVLITFRHLIWCFHTDLKSNRTRVWITGLQGFTSTMLQLDIKFIFTGLAWCLALIS